MLVTRTYCDVWMIQNGTMIERYCVDLDFKFVSAVKYMPGTQINIVFLFCIFKSLTVESLADVSNCSRGTFIPT